MESIFCTNTIYNLSSHTDGRLFGLPSVGQALVEFDGPGRRVVPRWRLASYTAHHHHSHLRRSGSTGNERRRRRPPLLFISSLCRCSCPIPPVPLPLSTRDVRLIVTTALAGRCRTRVLVLALSLLLMKAWTWRRFPLAGQQCASGDLLVCAVVVGRPLPYAALGASRLRR